ncbi:MAG: hypothetical protein AB7T06_44705 [Kofleriaceae bacterium]
MKIKPMLVAALLVYCVVPVRAQPGATTPPAPAPKAVAAAEQAPRSLVVHVAPVSTAPGQAVELEAMIDAPFAEALLASWRPVGATDWIDVQFERSSAGGWFATLPAPRPPGLEYFIHGKDANGVEIAHFASADHPHVVRVDPAEIDRLEEIDLERLDGHRNSVSFEVMGHNFGNRYGFKDEFIRGEATFTYSVLRYLHHIAFGFGAIEGRTPIYSDVNDDVDVRRATRYGFGEIRVRPHRSVFLDLRVDLGVSHDGFDQGARGVITFGKPWRSNVSVGGEIFGDMGGTAWVRLQWDTAPPLLMGASIVRTDLPGVSIDPNGLFIAYDLSYRMQDRFSVKGQLSYGARDGAAHFGGGLGGALEF